MSAIELPMADHAANLVRRTALYGTCEECGEPRDIKVTDSGPGRHVDLWCPACG